MPVLKSIRFGMLFALLVAAGTSCTTQSPPPRSAPVSTAGTPPRTSRTNEPPNGLPANNTPIQESSGPLSLSAALALTLTQNPDLSLFPWQIRVTEARALQAALRPNPEAGLELENALGTGDFRGAREAETTLQISQLIELGRKRMARTEHARLETDLLRRDYEIAKITALARAADAFIDVLSLQERLRLSAETVQLGQQTLQTVSQRVDAARAFAVEKTKAQIALNSAQIEHDQLQRALETARLDLASHWASSLPKFERAEGSLEELQDVPPFETFTKQLQNNPELARRAAEIAERQAAVRLERARRVPDVTLGGGYRRFNGPDDNALVASLSVPLPLFNQGQHTLQEAEARLRLAEEEQRTAQLKTTAQLRQAWQHLDAAHHHATSIRKSILPDAQLAFETISQYYTEGRLSYLDVLDAQRTLYSARAEYYRALQEYHHAQIAIDRLIGHPAPIDLRPPSL